VAPARVVDQELVVHLFAPFAGPHAADAYAEFRRTWRQCRELLGMTVPLDRPNLARDLPETLDQLPRNPGGGEIIVAAQKHPDALHQAILRVFHGVLNLSVLLSPRRRSRPEPGRARLG
jgi:hypothetical protein